MKPLSLRILAPGRDFRYAAKHPLDMAEVLAKHGYDVEVVSPMPDDVRAIHAERGFRIRAIPSLIQRFPARFRNVGTILLSFLIGFSYVDITIGVDPTGYLLAHQLKKMGRTANLIYYAMEMVLLEDRPNQSSVKYQARHIRDADLVISTGVERAAMMKERLSLKELPMVIANTFVTPPAVQPQLRELIAERGGVAPPHLVIFLGKLFDQHALKETIRSIPQWPRTVGFAYAGYGDRDYVDKLADLARELDVTERVFYLGTVPSGAENVFRLLKGADVALVFKKYRGGMWNDVYYTPTKLLEYAAMALPVICSDQASLRFVEEERWGRSVDVNKPDQIAAAVQYWFADDGRRCAAAQRALSLFHGKYSMEQQIEPLLTELVALRSIRERAIQ